MEATHSWSRPLVPTECSCDVPRRTSDSSLEGRQGTPVRASVSCRRVGAGTLRVALDQVLAGEPVAAAVRVEILESWRRAVTWGLVPDRIETPDESAEETGGDLDAAAEVVVSTLGDDLVGTHTTVVVADARGRIVRRRSADPAAPDRLDGVRLAPGAVWAERHVGTNGIGTTLQRGTATLVASDEHFAQSLTGTWSAGAPIHEPDSGRLVGVVGIFCRAHDATGLMIGLARRAARDVEQRLGEQLAGDQRLLRDRFCSARRHARGPVALVAADTLLTNAAAARLLGAADHPSLWAWATDAPISTATPLQLSSGTTVMATAEPVRSRTRIVAVVVRIATANTIPTSSSRAHPPGPATRFGWASLTVSELAVAERVARGHTNREVAADLYMSPHTIDTHLRHIYTKLAITSRVQLTRLVITHTEPTDLDKPGAA
jgi:transcriptional regulator of acetoin/glycerol metabolism